METNVRVEVAAAAVEVVVVAGEGRILPDNAEPYQRSSYHTLLGLTGFEC